MDFDFTDIELQPDAFVTELELHSLNVENRPGEQSAKYVRNHDDSAAE
jgi:hypothetical protein